MTPNDSVAEFLGCSWHKSFPLRPVLPKAFARWFLLHLALMSCILAIGVLMTGTNCSAATSPARHPNIVMILVDDLSWSDLGCYGNSIHDTPNIDRLASEGMLFTQAYAPAPICSASRAAIMTGKFPARLNFEFVTKNEPGNQAMNVPLQSPPFTMNLPLKEQTVGEELANAGYTTGFFGKWHINQHYQRYLGWSPTHGPLQQGFMTGDGVFGSHPYAYRKTKLADQAVAPGIFVDDTLIDKANSFIRGNRDGPFFLYLSQYFVHDPVHSRCQWLLDKYRKRLAGNGPKSRAAYGAMVETMDHLVGHVLKTLQQEGIAEDTMVVLMSDNGGHPNHTTNAPLRGSKWNLYEGGIRVPLIVRWPSKVAAGAKCNTAVHGCDLMPTFCDIAKSKPTAASIDGVSLLNLLSDPDAPLVRNRPLVWHFPYYHPEKKFAKSPKSIGVGDFVTSQTRPQSAIRHENFKLLAYYEHDRVELYDLSKDIGESRNLADEKPELAGQLKAQLQASLQSMEARLPVARTD